MYPWRLYSVTEVSSHLTESCSYLEAGGAWWGGACAFFRRGRIRQSINQSNFIYVSLVHVHNQPNEVYETQ